MNKSNFAFPAEVEILNKKAITLDQDSPPHFQLHQNSRVTILDTVTFGSNVTIAAATDARIALDNCHLSNCTIIAARQSSLYLRHCKITQNSLVHSFPSKRSLLEYVTLMASELKYFTHIAGKRSGANRAFRIERCNITGLITLKGHNALAYANIFCPHPHKITLHHGYAERLSTATNTTNNHKQLTLADIALGEPTRDPSPDR